MPVSSVAFVVCNCESKVVNHTSVGAITSLWTNGKEEAAFALESAGKIMKFFEDYFDFKFPLPKIDFVVVPNLAETALNSWGLVFFRCVRLFAIYLAENYFFKGFVTIT